MRKVRRIVTTDDANGKSEVLIDGVASRTITVLTELWITDSKEPSHRDKHDHAERSAGWSLRRRAPCFDTSRSRLRPRWRISATRRSERPMRNGLPR